MLEAAAGVRQSCRGLRGREGYNEQTNGDMETMCVGTLQVKDCSYPKKPAF